MGAINRGLQAHAEHYKQGFAEAQPCHSAESCSKVEGREQVQCTLLTLGAGLGRGRCTWPPPVAVPAAGGSLAAASFVGLCNAITMPHDQAAVHCSMQGQIREGQQGTFQVICLNMHP